jgi:hypothetical protein
VTAGDPESAIASAAIGDDYARALVEALAREAMPR